MCTGLPARVVQVVGPEAEVDTGEGRTRRAYLAASETIRKGDYVLLYANLVVRKIGRREALETLGYLGQMGARAAEEEGIDAHETGRLLEQRVERLAGKQGRRQKAPSPMMTTT